MKTPREILLERHQGVLPQLDALRAEVLQGELRPVERRAIAPQNRLFSLASLPVLFWKELIFPCRRVWTGLAVVWLLIFTVNVCLRDSASGLASKVPVVEAVVTSADQQKLLNELLADRIAPVEAEPPRTFSPRPRTEGRGFFSL